MPALTFEERLDGLLAAYQADRPADPLLLGTLPARDGGGDKCECDRRIDAPHEEGCPAETDGEYDDGLKGSDVFIVEGRQERYGSKDAWAVARADEHHQHHAGSARNPRALPGCCRTRLG